jgi:phosphorylcholine metabolism protein LicD
MATFTGQTLSVNEDNTKDVLVTTWTGDRQRVVKIPAQVKYFSPDAMVREDNLEQVLAENELMKPFRVEALRVVIEWLNQIEVPYWISDGTLLAAYRDNGVMIPKDVDCDVSIMESELSKLYENRHLLPENYRLNTSSCGVDYASPELINSTFKLIPGQNMAKKFCVHDKRDYSHIVKETLPPEIDIYTYRIDEEDPSCVRSNYAKLSQHVHLRKWQKDWIFPLTNIVFEGLTCTGPNSPKEYLEELYGYIGPNGYFNPETKKYEKYDHDSQSK